MLVKWPAQLLAGTLPQRRGCLQNAMAPTRTVTSKTLRGLAAELQVRETLRSLLAVRVSMLPDIRLACVMLPDMTRLVQCV
jgi:hypothetical protein